MTEAVVVASSPVLSVLGIFSAICILSKMTALNIFHNLFQWSFFQSVFHQDGYFSEKEENTC